MGKVLTHTYITRKIWGNSMDSDIASLRVFMATLRKKLEKDGGTQYIQTHIGVGYRMLRCGDRRGKALKTAYKKSRLRIATAFLHQP